MLKFLIHSVLPAVLLMVTAKVSVAHASNNCQNCEEIRKVAAEFNDFSSTDDDAETALILKAAKAVGKFGKNTKLSEEQIKVVTTLLRTSYTHDPDFAIIDNNFSLFEGNEKAFFLSFKKLPKPDSENLQTELEVKLGEAKYGNGGDLPEISKNKSKK